MEWNNSLRLATPYITLLLGLLLAWVAWSFKRKFVTREDYEADRAKLQERQASLARQHEAALAGQSALETAIKNLPTAKDMHALALSLEEVRGDMKALSQEMKGQGNLLSRMEKIVDLLNEVHMENRK